ncbi:uncharacterized protein UHOD_11946 [Ustilago sp. UG-2017b]|nr:uncharacterized protein UHOD_11946 [Ustilago sp. UG-2017b]
MTISQSGYIDQVLAKHLDKHTRPAAAPMQEIPEGTTVASRAQQKEYPMIIGKLLWIANSTRPDLSLTVSVLARHMWEPSQEHYQAAQRVLHYLKSTKEVGLIYRANELQEPLVAHSDTNWASDATIQRKSTSGSVAFVYGNPVTWKSATQKCVSLSAVEAEFIAATEATCEVLFLKQLLRSIGIATSTPTIYSDNTGCIQVSKDPAQHWKLKHIDTKYHFICNNVQGGRVQVKYVDTKRNLADVLTKPVGKQAIQQARLGLHLQMPMVGIETRPPSYAAILQGPSQNHTLQQQHDERTLDVVDDDDNDDDDDERIVVAARPRRLRLDEDDDNDIDDQLVTTTNPTHLQPASMPNNIQTTKEDLIPESVNDAASSAPVRKDSRKDSSVGYQCHTLRSFDKMASTFLAGATQKGGFDPAEIPPTPKLSLACGPHWPKWPTPPPVPTRPSPGDSSYPHLHLYQLPHPTPTVAAPVPAPPEEDFLGLTRKEEWLPYADRIRFPEQNSGSETPIEPKPILPFTELPPFEINRRNYDSQINPGVVRYGVPPSIKLTTPIARADTACRIIFQLQKLYPGFGPSADIHFFKKNKQTLMDLMWKDPENRSFNPTTPLSLRDAQLVFIGMAASIKPNWITIKIIDLDANIYSEINLLAENLVMLLHPHRILDFWTTRFATNTEVDGCTALPWACELYLLVELSLKAEDNNGFTHPADVANNLPGWVDYGTQSYKLLYRDRFDHCVHCKNNVRHRHTYRDCEAAHSLPKILTPPPSSLTATTTTHLSTNRYPSNIIQHMTDLHILSWNCRGIDSTPAAKILDWNTLTRNVDLVLLQEPAFSSSSGRYRTFDPHTLFQELAPAAIGTRVHTSYATPFCAIIILNRQITLLAPQHRANQRIVHACITFRDQSIAIASIYAPAPHTKRQLFFETFPSRVMDSNTPTILGGDWNDAPSTLDFLNIRDNRSHLWRYIEHKISSAGFFDPLRVLQAEDRIYTRFQMNRDGSISSASRIDFFLVNTSVLHRCHLMETLPSHSSDHSAFLLGIANSANLAPAQDEGYISRWKLPQPMARYQPFSQQAHTFIEQTYSQVLHPPRGISIAEAYTMWIERCRNFAKLTGYQLRLPFLQAHQEIQTLRRRIGSWDFTAALAKAKPSHSAAGISGLPHVFFTCNSNRVAEIMCRLANSIRSGRSLPAFYPLAAGTLLFKKGSTSNPAHYRPLSVLDSDIRIIGAVLQHRLLPAVDELTPESQTGFIAGRSIFNSALCLQVTISLVNLGVSSPGSPTTSVLVIDQDQQKAFDKVDREWLWAVLRYKNFPTSFIRYIRIFYDHPHVSYNTGSSSTSPIPLQRGVLQGMPSSPLLYLLAYQPPLDAIAHDHIGFSVRGILDLDNHHTTTQASHNLLSSTSYADNTVIFVANDQQLHRYMHRRQQFDDATGANLNPSTSYRLIHPAADHPLPTAWSDAVTQHHIQLNLEDEWSFLGACFHRFDLYPSQQFDILIDRFRAQLRTIFRGRIDIIRRTHLLNTHALSLLWHSLTIGIPPTTFFTTLFHELDLGISVHIAWEDLSDHELLSLPWFHTSYNITFPTGDLWQRHQQHILNLRRQGFLAFADILWTDGSTLSIPDYHDLAADNTPSYMQIQYPKLLGLQLFGVEPVQAIPQSHHPNNHSRPTWPLASSAERLHMNLPWRHLQLAGQPMPNVATSDTYSFAHRKTKILREEEPYRKLFRTTALAAISLQDMIELIDAARTTREAREAQTTST